VKEKTKNDNHNNNNNNNSGSGGSELREESLKEEVFDVMSLRRMVKEAVMVQCGVRGD